MRFEGKIKWNQEGTRGEKGSQWGQVMEGTQILNKQAGQKITLFCRESQSKGRGNLPNVFGNIAIWY